MQSESCKYLVSTVNVSIATEVADLLKSTCSDTVARKLSNCEISGAENAFS